MVGSIVRMGWELSSSCERLAMVGLEVRGLYGPSHGLSGTGITATRVCAVAASFSSRGGVAVEGLHRWPCDTLQGAIGVSLTACPVAWAGATSVMHLLGGATATRREVVRPWP